MPHQLHYILLIATDSYTPNIVAISREMAPLQFLKVIIVVNGARCEAVKQEYLQHSTFAELWTTPSRGKSLARNSYLKTIDNPNLFCIFTDDDIEMHRGILRKSIRLEPMELNKDCGLPLPSMVPKPPITA